MRTWSRRRPRAAPIPAGLGTGPSAAGLAADAASFGRRRQRVGYAALIASSVLFGFSAPTARWILDHGASFVELTQARAWISAPFLGILLLVSRSTRPERRRRANRGSAMLVVVFGIALGLTNVSFYQAASRIPVGIASVTAYLAPIFVVTWKWVTRRGAPSRSVVVALTAGLVGISLLSGALELLSSGRLGLDPVGLLAALASAIGYTVLILIGERLSQTIGAERAVFYGYSVAAAMWLLVLLATGWPSTIAEPRLVPWIVGLGVLGTAVPYLLVTVGWGVVDVRRAGVVSMLDAVVSATVSFLWLHQVLTPVQIAGGVMVLASAASMVGRQAPERIGVEPRP